MPQPGHTSQQPIHFYKVMKCRQASFKPTQLYFKVYSIFQKCDAEFEGNAAEDT